MAINSLTFDGVNSKDYGIYISGPGVFDAPARKYEMVSIPGRNGQYAIDEGTYDNIEITYPAFVTDYTQYSFAERMSQIRNVFGSKSGYCRLYDSYNPDEFRLALFSNGVEVEPKHYNSTGEFNLIFNCKPQRYLVSGETPVEVTSGEALVNQTQFEARPLIILNAINDGTLNINDQTIGFVTEDYGRLPLNNTRPTGRGYATTGTWSASVDLTWDVNDYNIGDPIDASDYCAIRMELAYNGFVDHLHDMEENITLRSVNTYSAPAIMFNFIIPNSSIMRFNAGTVKTSNFMFSTIIEYQTAPAEPTQQEAFTFSGTVTYGQRADGTPDDKCVSFSLSGQVPTNSQYAVCHIEMTPRLNVISSKSIIEGDFYFDTEACESYIYNNNGDRISINGSTIVGADFPALSPGVNEISYTGGIETCKIVPRWWKI